MKIKVMPLERIKNRKKIITFIAKSHLKYIRPSDLSKIGFDFLFHFYYYLHNNQGIILVLFYNKKPIGFIAAETYNKKKTEIIRTFTRNFHHIFIMAFHYIKAIFFYPKLIKFPAYKYIYDKELLKKARPFDSQFLFIAIKPSYRNKGNGSILIEKSVEKLKRAKCKKAILTIVKDNISSVELVLSQSFKIIDKRVFFERDTLIFAKDL